MSHSLLRTSKSWPRLSLSLCQKTLIPVQQPARNLKLLPEVALGVFQTTALPILEPLNALALLGNREALLGKHFRTALRMTLPGAQN